MPAACARRRRARRVVNCPSLDLYGRYWRDATVEPKCIGKGWIRHVYFRMAYNLEFQAAELLPSGGTSIAANAGLAEIGRSQGERISAGAVQRPAFASPCTDSESD